MELGSDVQQFEGGRVPSRAVTTGQVQTQFELASRIRFWFGLGETLERGALGGEGGLGTKRYQLRLREARTEQRSQDNR